MKLKELKVLLGQSELVVMKVLKAQNEIKDNESTVYTEWALVVPIIVIPRIIRIPLVIVPVFVVIPHVSLSSLEFIVRISIPLIYKIHGTVTFRITAIAFTVFYRTGESLTTYQNKY